MRAALLLLASLAAVSSPAVDARAQAAPAIAQFAADPYAAFIAEAAQRFAIPAAWIRAVMHHESRGVWRAVSAKGAMGLMQIMPDTWTALRARYGFGRDPFDLHDNIMAGAAFLREMHDRYGSPGFLAAYSAGPGRYEDYRDRRRPLPAETAAYVTALAPLVGEDARDGTILAASPEAPSWTEAPLFITRSVSAESAGDAPKRQPATDKPTVLAVQDVSAIAPQSGDLFVHVSSAGARP